MFHLARTLPLAALVALAALPAAGYTVKGSVDCADIIREDGDSNFREMNKWWLLGYFTARNYETDAEVGRGLEDENLYQMALDYCRADSSKDWDDAAIQIYDRLD